LTVILIGMALARVSHIVSELVITEIFCCEHRCL